MLKIGILFVLLLFVPIGILGETIGSNAVELSPSNFEHVELSLTNNRTIMLTGFSGDQLILYVFENDNFNKWVNQMSFEEIHSQFVNQSFEIQLDPEVSDNYRLHLVFVNFNEQDVDINYEITVDDIKTEKLGVVTWLPFLSFLPIVFGRRKKPLTCVQ